MVENIIRVISDNRFWIMPLLLCIEIPVAGWMVWKMFKEGVKEFNRERQIIQSSRFKIQD